MAGITAAIIGGGVALAGDAYKYIQGANQKSQAAQLAKNNPFVAEQMPAEVKQATQLAQRNYTNGLPGQQYAQNQIDRNASTARASAERGASSGGDILDSANKIQLGANDATQQLAMQAASYKSNALGGYEAALGTQAGWEDQLYKNNTLQPYLRAANTAASLQGAGSINEASAIDNAESTVMAGGENYANAKYKNYLTRDGKTMGQYLNAPTLAAITPRQGYANSVNSSNINAKMAASILSFGG